MIRRHVRDLAAAARILGSRQFWTAVREYWRPTTIAARIRHLTEDE